MFATIKQWFSNRSLNKQSVTPCFYSAPTLAGVNVTTETALQCPAVACAVTTLSNDLSSIPIPAYERLEEGKEKADTHPVHVLLNVRPNNVFTTPSNLKKTFWQAVFTEGNGYLLISRNGAGRPVELLNIAADRVQVKVAAGTYFYVLDGKELVQPSDMIHVRFHSNDGVQGIGPIRIGRQVIGLALALDRYGAAFFGNGARPSGILKYPGTMSDQARENLRASWNSEHQGTSNYAKTAVLEQGADYSPISTANEEAQFNETRQLVTVQIAQLWNIPPHKLKDLGRATWGNISSESLSYVRDSLRPWTVQLEEEIQLKLFSPAEQSKFCVEHQFKELLRADDLTRHQVYSMGVSSGIYTPNECRALENLPPLEDEPEPEPQAPEQEAPNEGTPIQPEPEPTDEQ